MVTAIFRYVVLAITIAIVQATPYSSSPTLAARLSSPDQTAPSSKWSKEAIFALVSIPISIFGILISILIASPRARRQLRGSLHVLLNPCDNGPQNDLERKYEEWLRFQEWLEMIEGRTVP
ncbi:hypothetical protein BKA63DRAFT_484965 [Paraphoma chrysanthemicola]|nr:hypothetical protein BKA63DRAFT_484965 [Paraphoma chrysanthemicola]